MGVKEKRKAFKNSHLVIKRCGLERYAHEVYKSILFEGFDKYAPTSASGERCSFRDRGPYRLT